MRILGMRLNAKNQLRFPLVTQFEAACATNDLPHLAALLSIAQPGLTMRDYTDRLAISLRYDCAAMSDLRLYICGRLAIEWEGGTILERDFPARQGRLMWAALVLGRRRPASREDLAEAIWGEDIPDGWDTALNGLASRLRAMLRPPSTQLPQVGIRGDVGRYALTLPRDAFIDMDRARSGLHAAETALHRGALDEALSEARVAMEIAARGFLDGEHAPWVEGQRRSLEEIRIHAMECTLQAEIARGNFRRAEREAEELTGLDPLNETAYRVRMQASAALGNRAGIVRAMEACRQVLREQAGLDPSSETERLFGELTGRK